jgi:hypothetical protein
MVPCSVPFLTHILVLILCLSAPSKQTLPFLALNAETASFCDLNHESTLLSVPKNIGDCMRSHNGSNDTALEPPHLSFCNIFKNVVTSMNNTSGYVGSLFAEHYNTRLAHKIQEQTCIVVNVIAEFSSPRFADFILHNVILLGGVHDEYVRRAGEPAEGLPRPLFLCLQREAY